MDTQILEELGLTRTEIKTYITLLEIGASSAGKIIEKSSLPNSTIHRDLNSLIEKSLINFILEGRKKIYQATDPEQFFRFMDDKKKRFQDLLPELKSRQNTAISKESASIYKGIKGIKEVYGQMINAEGKEYNTFGGGPISAEVMGWEWWQNLHLRRIENKLPSRQVFDLTVKKGGQELAKKPLTKIKYVDEKFASFQETIICGDFVAIAIFSKEPYAFMIKDQNVADSYRKYFEILWSMAK
jgi:sugar-specific transcriptional regulator TrmB